MRTLVNEFPGDVPLHLILDNYGTHKHEKVRGWLQRHPRFELHFVPASSSWLNLLERWFGEMSQKAIRRRAFGSVEELKACSEELGPISSDTKCAGARCAGNSHATCEVAGAGNGATDRAQRARRGKPRIQPSQRPDGPPRQFPTLRHLSHRLSAVRDTPPGRSES